MINTRDQEALFTLIADYLKKDISCIAIGGTAMMFMGYKNATKDIDLVFKSDNDRDVFIKAIEALGYKQKAIMGIYPPNREQHKGKPVMYSRGEERFDLFVKDVFGIEVSTDFPQRQDFIGKKQLLISLATEEELILMKAITGREKDVEDIEAIATKKKDIDWMKVAKKAVEQRKHNQWILYDMEAALRRLKKTFFIKQDVIDVLYKGEEKVLKKK